MKNFPRLTDKKLSSIGIYVKLSPVEKKMLRKEAIKEFKEHNNDNISIRVAYDHLRKKGFFNRK